MKTWVLYAILSAIFAGLTAVIAKVGLKDINADLGNMIRTGFVFVFIVGMFFYTKQSIDTSRLTLSVLAILFLSAVTTALSWVFYYRALKIGEVSYVSMIDKGSIVITVLLSVLLLGETLSLKVIAGLTLIVSGLLVLVL
jgi:transporter family protein